MPSRGPRKAAAADSGRAPSSAGFLPHRTRACYPLRMQTSEIRAGRQDVARGLNPAQPIGSADVVALMRLLSEKVQTSVRHSSVDPLMEFVYAHLTAGARYIEHIPVSCGKGCSFCCHLWVDAAPPEVLFAVKSMPAEQRQLAANAVEQACLRSSGKSFKERCSAGNPPCPLLRDNACSVYETRPIVCRTLVSTNVQECKDTFLEGSEAGFPSLKVWAILRHSYSTALEGALIHAGLAYRAHDLNESLRIALSTPDAEQRWLSGTDDFADAPISPAPETFQSPMWRGIYQQAFGKLPS